MAGRKRTRVNYSFEAGQADQQYARRIDSELWIRSAKSLRNCRIVNGGGAHRRPGLARIAATAGPVRFSQFVARNTAKRMLAFRPSAVDIYMPSFAIEQTLSASCPWVSDDLATMQFGSENNRVIVTSHSFLMQNVERTTAGVWSITPFAYDTGPGGSVKQPYFRFSDSRGITLRPSALTGSITLTADVALFVAGHVGTRFRILTREMLVTAYISPTQVTVTVIQTLYPTMRWTVGSSTGFGVGDQVITSVDNIEAEVAAIVSGTQIDVILTNSFTNPVTASNTVAGPKTSSPVTVVAAAPAELATTQWDEQMISSVRGYPNGCVFHKSRLILIDFPQAPEFVAASAVGIFNDFDTGLGLDDDAFIEGIGDAPGKRIRHAISAEQLIVLGDAGAYYVGDGAQSVLTPTTVDFLPIGPEPVGDSNPVRAAEGVVYRESQADRIMLLTPTGTVRRSWNTTELGDISSDLLSNPTRLCIADGSDIGPERYVIALNDDAQLAVMHFRRGAEVVGWVPWDTDGDFIDVAMFDRSIWTCVNRVGNYTIEAFDIDRLTDESVLISNAALATPTDATWMGKEISLVWRDTVGTEERRVEVGLFSGDIAGVLTGAPTEARSYEGGRRFYPEITLWPPIDGEAGPRTWVRVSRASVDVTKSGQYYVEGKAQGPYRAADDLTQPPPLRTGWRALKLLNRSRDPEISITQVESAPLQVRAVVLDAT